MVQIIPANTKHTFGRGLLEAIPSGLDAFGKVLQNRKDAKASEEEDEALEALGVHVKGIKNQKLREGLLEGAQQQQKSQAQEAKAQKSTETIQKYFGPDAGNIYGELTEGGKTKFFESLMENVVGRKIPINEFLPQFIQQNIEDFQPEQPEEAGQMMPKSPPQENFNMPKEREIDEGLTPQEKVARQEKRYEKNLPLYEETDKKLAGLKNEDEVIEILEELNESKKLPKGLGRVNINYKEGNLLVPALSSPEAQRYIKTVNEFLSKAKDTFGSRVTNFELDRFLQRLPTLANTEEGRREILKQMKYFNKIEKTYQEALSKYVDSKGGIRNVDWDVAKRRARDMAEPLIKEAKAQFKNSDKISKELYDKKLADVKSKTPAGKIAVEKDGQFGYIDKKMAAKALKSGGYKKL
jgi:hypothetical protein